MNKRKIFIVITAFVLTAILAGSLGAVTALAWPFSDVPPSNDFYNDIAWLDANGITHGCDALGHYCPGDYVTRGQMAAFLHRSAGVQVVAGVHITRDLTHDTPVIDDWFNNVTGYAPSVSYENNLYFVWFGMNMENRYPLCTIDQGYGDTLNAICTVDTHDNRVQVGIWDPDTGVSQHAEFYLLVFGP